MPNAHARSDHKKAEPLADCSFQAIQAWSIVVDSRSLAIFHGVCEEYSTSLL